jgi:hypothetical protein
LGAHVRGKDAHIFSRITGAAKRFPDPSPDRRSRLWTIPEKLPQGRARNVVQISIRRPGTRNKNPAPPTGGTAVFRTQTASSTPMSGSLPTRRRCAASPSRRGSNGK